MRAIKYLFTGLLLTGCDTEADTNAVAVSSIDAAERLTTIVEQRLLGDRTEACFAVAFIDGLTTEKTIVCADPNKVRKLDTNTAFEIGSVSKTMVAAVVAALIDEGRLTLDTPLNDLLPGVAVAQRDDQPILLRHILTHSSGLPALPEKMASRNPADPYGGLNKKRLYDSLEQATLASSPGAEFAYSNFALMALSHALAEFTGKSFESLLAEYVTTPVGMTNTYIDDKPKGTKVAKGHLQNARKTRPWNFKVDTGGVGGVRASLDDMIRYVQANLGLIDTPVNGLLSATHQAITDGSGQAMGMAWFIAPLGERQLRVHEGGTGGFSSFVGFDPIAKTGVVILSDTSQNAVSGLSGLALHLFDNDRPLPGPRTLAEPEPELLEGLAGEYFLDGGLGMTVTHDDGSLFIQATGQPKFKMVYDSAGDFFPERFDALLRPQPTPSGYTFTWLQRGGVMRASRVGGDAAEAVELSPQQLAEYEGEYPLMPGFSVKVFSKEGSLHIQGTGQSSAPVEALGEDRFVNQQVGALFIFARDEAGEVVSVELKQGGATLSGDKQ